LGSPGTPVVMQGGVGASGTKAPTASMKKIAALARGRHIRSAHMLEVASSVESQESSPHNPPPKVASRSVMTSTAGDTTPSWRTDASLQLVTTAGGSGASASRVVATTSIG
jgi:hypothetical protein